MIKGTGIDIVEINRFREIIKKYGKKFLNRVFTESEIRYCESKPDPAQHYAGRFAAKEAVIKALPEPVNMRKIEIITKGNGAPSVVLQRSKQNTRLFLSISHDKEYAIAQAIVEE